MMLARYAVILADFTLFPAGSKLQMETSNRIQVTVFLIQIFCNATGLTGTVFAAYILPGSVC